jgi:hypothetical protein
MSDRNAFHPLLDRIVLSAGDPIPPDTLTLHHQADQPAVEPTPSETATRLATQAFPGESTAKARPAPKRQPEQPRPESRDRKR